MPIYKIHNRYKDGDTPIVTGHLIEVPTSEEAIRLSIKHGIAYPFHRVFSSQEIIGIVPLPIARNRRGKIWCENNKGELSSK